MASVKDSKDVLVVDRRRTKRRKSEDQAKTPKASRAKKQTSEEDRREKPERRRQIDPTTCERDYSDAEIDFMKAMDDYKRKSGRMFPTWSEVLEVLHCMGYRRVEEPTELVMK